MAKRFYGKQKPRIKVAPKYKYSDGTDASELVKAYGYELDPWQRDVIKDWLGRDEQDKFTSTTCGLSVPRQNGKNTLLEVRELYGLATMGEKIIHTAHQVNTAREAFLRLSSFFKNKDCYPELARLVKTIRSGNGMEEIELENGGRIKFSSRSNVSNLGFSVDLVVFDEAQALTDEQSSVIMPIISASPNDNRQMIYTGTPPTATMNGEVFARIRQSALEKTNPKVTWYEWSVEKLPPKGTKVDELVRLAYDVNPAMGRRLDEDFTRQEALGMSLDGFSIMRLGWWSETNRAVAISEDLWSKTFIKPQEVPQDGFKTYGVKFSVDGAYVALSGCKTAEGGTPHVELICYEPIHEGFEFIREFFSDEKRVEDTAGIAIDGRNGTGMLINELASQYYRQVLMIPSTKGCIEASSMFEQALYEGAVTHTNGEAGEQNELTNSAINAIKRPCGSSGSGAWIYGGEDSAPLESATLALWANKTTNIEPSRKAVVW